MVRAARTSGNGALPHHISVFMFMEMAVIHNLCLAVCGLIEMGRKLGLVSDQNVCFQPTFSGTRRALFSRTTKNSHHGRGTGRRHQACEHASNRAIQRGLNELATHFI